tara:strand:+ start:3816 stop:4529 length:714 start_codon:yes stop_codon:yes gene_type:complete
MNNSSLPLIIETDIDNLYNIYTSNDFIKKLFSLSSNEIKNYDNKIEINKIYTSDELNNILNYSKYISNKLIINQIENLKKFKTELELNIIQEVIKKDNNSLIIKYICNIDKPGYIKTLLSNQSTIFYIKINKMEKNNNLLIQYTYRKFIPCELMNNYNDEFILEERNILNNNSEYNDIIINQGLLLTANTILGEELVKEIIIPSIYTIFEEFIEKPLDKRIKKILKKKNIKIYSKKK